MKNGRVLLPGSGSSSLCGASAPALRATHLQARCRQLSLLQPRVISALYQRKRSGSGDSPSVCDTAETLAKGFLPLPSERGTESDIPGLALPAAVKRFIQPFSHSFHGHWLCARHCVKPSSMVILCIHSALGDGAGSIAKYDPNSSKFPRDSEKGEINAAWQ